MRRPPDRANRQTHGQTGARGGQYRGEKSHGEENWTREGLEVGTGAGTVGRVGASERAVQVLSVLAQAASPLPDLLRLPCCVSADAPLYL